MENIYDNQIGTPNPKAKVKAIPIPSRASTGLSLDKLNPSPLPEKK